MSNSGSRVISTPSLSSLPVKQSAPSRSYGRQPFEPVHYKTFEIRLAKTDAELDAAQALRYQVFYEEMGATASIEVKLRKRDFDPFDAVCDHLLVFDKSDPDKLNVVGTYRLMRRSVALEHFGFYSEQEYDIAPLLSYPGEIVELGRSCVAADYRAKGVMQLLWRGLAEYLAAHRIDLMFGCASLPGRDPARWGAVLKELHADYLAGPTLRARAVESRYVDMAAYDDGSQEGEGLPPLMKGYLRVGAVVGDGAVIDEQFSTVDVMIIVETEKLTAKYARHYNTERAG